MAMLNNQRVIPSNKIDYGPRQVSKKMGIPPIDKPDAVVKAMVTSGFEVPSFFQKSQKSEA